MATIGFFGGSFNPPHIGHQMVCLVALASGEVDEVWLVPTVRHAFAKPLAPFADRMEMCRRAASLLCARVSVHGIEAERQDGPSHTLDTLVELARRHPEHGFRLVVGADILAERDRWHRWDDVVALAPPLVIGRAGSQPEARGTAQLLELPNVSSSDLRRRLRAGEDAVPLVSRPVMDYIAERGLYR